MRAGILAVLLVLLVLLVLPVLLVLLVLPVLPVLPALLLLLMWLRCCVWHLLPLLPLPPPHGSDMTAVGRAPLQVRGPDKGHAAAANADMGSGPPRRHPEAGVKSTHDAAMIIAIAPPALPILDGLIEGRGSFCSWITDPSYVNVDGVDAERHYALHMAAMVS